VEFKEEIRLSLGDIITALDWFLISNTHDLLSYIENNKLTGDKIAVSIYRNNQTDNLIATLEERPISECIYLIV
jgi:S1-C subfamily serine protease